MILVAGATGTLGGEICRLLSEKGRATRALVRASAAKEGIATLRSLGAEIVEGDFRDRPSLDRACRNIEAVVCTVSSLPGRYQPGSNDIESVDRRGVISLIDAARAAGVQHFVFTSFTANTPSPLHDAKREAEAHLASSGMTYTVLRPSFFMEFWLSPAVGFDFGKGVVRVLGSGEQPVSYISVRDVAQFAVKSLDNPKARNATLRIGGPEAVSPRKAVRIFEEAGDRKFTVDSVPESDLVAQQKAAVEPMQKSFASLSLDLGKYGDVVDTRDLAKQFGIRLRSVEEYARESLRQKAHV